MCVMCVYCVFGECCGGFCVYDMVYLHDMNLVDHVTHHLHDLVTHSSLPGRRAHSAVLDDWVEY